MLVNNVPKDYHVPATNQIKTEVKNLDITNPPRSVRGDFTQIYHDQILLSAGHC